MYMNFLVQVCLQNNFFQDHPPSHKSQMVQSLHHLICGLTDQFHPLSLILQIRKWRTLFDITGYPSNSIFISVVCNKNLTWVCYDSWPFVLNVSATSLMLIGQIWSNMRMTPSRWESSILRPFDVRESGGVPGQNFSGRFLFVMVTPKYETLHKVSRSLAVGTETGLRMITGNVTCS